MQKGASAPFSMSMLEQFRNLALLHHQAMLVQHRFRFASRCAAAHLVVSLTVALLSAVVVFGLWYPAPFRQMLQVGPIFLLVLAVDVVCGPLLTLILSSPSKSRRERWLDFSLIGAIQLLALVYGMYSVWLARPAVLAFEVDRLVVATANEVQADALPEAPLGLQRLPWAGVLRVGTRRAKSGAEILRGVELGLEGVSPAMLPDRWLPWADARDAMREKARPLVRLIELHPDQVQALGEAAQASGHRVKDLSYLPLTSSKTREWVALLDAEMNMVGFAPVDGF